MLSIVILDICLISIEAEVGFTQDSDTIHPTSLTKTGRYNNPSNNEVDIQLQCYRLSKTGIPHNMTLGAILTELWLSVTGPTVSDI